LLVLLAVSVLRVDVQATVVTGLIAVVGYGWLIVAALAKSDLPPPSPHPQAMYVALWGMVVLASVAAAFVAWQVREYVHAAVREVETRRQRDQFKRDLEIAGDIQRQLLPREMPTLGGYDFAAFSRPADESGGDYYDWQALGASRVVLSLGDVSGHGIGPALVTAACRAYVRAVLPKEPSLHAVLEHTNDLLRSDMPDGRFVTLAVADLDGAGHVLRLLSAGHGPTFHVRSSEGTVAHLDSQGMPLGPFDDPRLGEALELRLAVGDVVVLCSDGLFEAANEAGEPFGLARLAAVLGARRGERAAMMLTAVQEAVDTFCAGSLQLDDMTAVAIKRVG
jgi:serine phosphatase RsbU (regulator of sigma subunit)